MMRGLYAITPDLPDTDELLQKTAQAIAGGVRLLQYRNKLADAPLALAQASALRALTREHAVTFIINDDIELALTVDADGVHLGGDDGDLAQARARLPKGKLLGASCYNDLNLAHAAVAAGADYLAFGAIFPSSTKPLARRANLALLQEANRVFSLPIVAIGGITLQNAASVIETGTDNIALISALFDAPDITNAVAAFSDLFHVKQ